MVQTYQTLVGQDPIIAQQNHLLKVESKGGQNSLVPAIVASTSFYEQTAGGDPSGYVPLAAATLDVFPGPSEVNRLTRQVVVHRASAQVLNHVVKKLSPPGSKSSTPTGRPTASYELLKKNVLINADYWSSTPSILGASLGFTNIIGVPGLNGTNGTEALARRAGGTWETLTSASASTAALRAYTSAISPSGVALAYGYAVKNADGFPVEFSWPVLPSSVAAADFRVVLNTGRSSLRWLHRSRLMSNTTNAARS